MSWPLMKIGIISEVVTKGTTPTTLGRPFTESGINFIKAEALNGDSNIDPSSFAFIDEKTNEVLKRSILQENDVLITIAGINIGQCGFVRNYHLPANTNQAVSIVRLKSGVEPKFVYYFFKLPATLHFIQSQGGQSAQPNFNLGNLKNIEVPLPSVEIQKKIVNVLTAYDDLIENNRRRMALMEDAARQLYREWFVRLRFPGYEHTHVMDGVPQWWERKTLGDICSEVRDNVLPDALEPEMPYIGLEHMPRRSISLTDWGTAKAVTSTKHRFHQGDILFGKIRPYFHKVGIAFIDGVASSDAIVIRPSVEDMYCLVLATLSSDEFIAVTAQTMKEGSKMPRADWKQMTQYPVLLPPPGMLSSFSETIKPMIDQLRCLCFQNQKLRAARDLLLPRLMYGEIVV